MSGKVPFYYFHNWKKNKHWIKWWHKLWMWHGNSKWHVITRFMNRGIQTQNLRRWGCCRKRRMCSLIHRVPPVSATPSPYFHRFPPASPPPVHVVHSTVHKSAWLSEQFIGTQRLLEHSVYWNTAFIGTQHLLLHTSADLDVAVKLQWRSRISHYLVIDGYASYVYRTMHHCDSWRIKDQLDVTCYFILRLMYSACFGH